MEKQPIDDFFKRKLRDLEVIPNDLSWVTLQKRLGNQRIIPIWKYTAIAASLILISSLSWWLGTGNRGTLNETTTAKTDRQNTQSLSHQRKSKLAQVDKEQTLDSSMANLISINHHRAEAVGGDENRIVAESAKTFAESKPKSIQASMSNSESGEHLRLSFAIQDSSSALSQETLRPKKVELLAIKELAKDPSTVKTQVTTERILIVSIEAPVNSVYASDETIAVSDNIIHKTGFSNLLKKMKKLKDGDVLALNTSKTVKTSRRGFNRLYEDVKESIQNNSID